MALPGRSDASAVWVGAPGWVGYTWLMFVVAYVVVAEEVVWRGYLTPALGLLPSSLLFAAHHYAFGLRHVAFTAFAGLAWGALFVGSGSLVPAVVSHLVYNALAWAWLRRPPAGGRLQQPGTFSEPLRRLDESPG